MIYSISISGKPFAKQRPQVNNITRSVFTPTKTLNYESRVANLFQTKYPNHSLIKGPVVAMFFMWMPIPKSAAKLEKQKMIEGKVYPMNKSDIDNMVKCLQDGLNLIAYHDDGQVVDLSGVKRYGENPKALIILKEIE